MYLTEFTARNLKCFRKVTLDFPCDEHGSYAGWNVILGANATGKTTILQAMAVALVGPAPAMRLVSPASWVRQKTTFGEIEARFVRGEGDTAVGAPRREPYCAAFVVIGDKPVGMHTSPQVLLVGNSEDREYRGLVKGPYASNSSGWMVCGYGAFRRFTGGAGDDLSYEAGRVGRVASLFRESVALKRDLDWLPQLYARSLEVHAQDAPLAQKEYDTVRELLDQLLPSQVQIADVDTRRVYFSAPGASRVDLLELSDGYRSFLALVVDLLRQIADVFGGVAQFVRGDKEKRSVGVDGVVLIDEMDLHLHPTWQREIGPRLLEIFPKLQFIVSSHSPFIAQAAKRDGLFVFHAGNADEPIQVIKPARLVSGWTVEEILLSPLFGLSDTRDPETERLLDEHAKLRGKEKFDELTAMDQARLVAIERKLSERLTSPGELRKEDVDHAVKLAADKVRRGRIRRVREVIRPGSKED